MAEAQVLVTRPAGQADKLCAALEKQGYSVVHRPMLQIDYFKEPFAESRQRVIDLDLYQHVVFVSANAVRGGMTWFEQFWPQLPMGINWYGVGRSSADLLLEFGIQAIYPEQMDSEGLLALPQLASVAGHKVLLVKGEGGRDYIRAQLQARGAQVDSLETYRRQPAMHDRGPFSALFTSGTVDTVLVSSGEGLDNMVSLLGPNAVEILAEATLVVPGPRVAELAAEMGLAKLLVAENATDAAMLRALQMRNTT